MLRGFRGRLVDHRRLGAGVRRAHWFDHKVVLSSLSSRLFTIYPPHTRTTNTRLSLTTGSR